MLHKVVALKVLNKEHTICIRTHVYDFLFSLLSQRKIKKGRRPNRHDRNVPDLRFDGLEVQSPVCL